MTKPKSAAKRERRERAKQEKAERLRLARRRKRLRWIVGVVGAALVVGLATWGIVAYQRARQIEGVENFGGQDRGHTDAPVEYGQTPPIGGDHSGTPLTCGIYTGPVPDENAVHSLEHGAVWITYQPDLDESQVETLRTFVLDQNASARSHLILSPYEGLPAPVVASSWRRQLQLDRADDPRLAEFTDRFVRGSGAPERGAACQGVGTPDL
jgi:hypothetical protein